jgi:hypothetical protein
MYTTVHDLTSEVNYEARICHLSMLVTLCYLNAFAHAVRISSIHAYPVSCRTLCHADAYQLVIVRGM